MNDKLLHLQYMIIHFKPTLRQIYVIEMCQISYCKKQTNKEKKNKTKKTKENKTQFFFFTSPSQKFLDQKRLAGEDAIFVLLH